MDKDRLIAIWKSAGDSEEFNYSSDAIERIIKQGPRNIVANFLRILIIEKWLNVIMLGIFMITTLIRLDWVLAAVMLLANVLFFVYYQRLIKKLDIDYIDSNVVDYLNEVNRIIKRFMKHYIIASSVLVVPAYSLGLYMIEGALPDIFHRDYMFYFVYVATLILAVSAVFLYIEVVYGRKARKIKRMVELLNNEE